MQKNRNTKPKNVSYGKVPEDLWKQIEKHFLIYNYRTGRPRADNRAVLNAIWVILWSSSQWKAIERHWFGVSSSVIHERFQNWGRQGIFEEILKTMLRFYHRQCRITGNGNRLTLNLFPLRWETQIQVKTLLTEPSWAAKFISS